MRTLAVIAACLIGQMLPASAQEKLWTWKPTTKADWRTVHAIATSAGGSGAFVLGETKYTKDVPSSSYSLVWVNSKGKVLSIKKFPEVDLEQVHMIESASTSWRIGFLGEDRLGVFDGESLRVYRMKNGEMEEQKVPATGGIKPLGVSFFSAGSFDGMVTHELIQGPDRRVMTLHSPDLLVHTWDVKSLTAWRY